MRALVRVQHATKRIRQNFATFDNPVEVTMGMLGSRVPWRSGDVHLRHAGATVVVPANRGALFPVYEVFAEDTYRLDWITRGLPADAVALDIGGHVGSVAVLLAQRFPAGQVWVYEASPGTAEYLSRSVAESGLESRVFPRAEALSGERGTITLIDRGLCSPLTSGGVGAPEETVEVPAVTMADAFERAGGKVDLVKIDAEGIEYDLILRSSPDLWASVSRLMLEYHDVAGHDREELVAHLASLGLHEVAHEGMLGNPREGLLWFARDPDALG